METQMNNIDPIAKQLLDHGVKTMHQGLDSLWTDGESILQTGIIPLGDAIMGLTGFVESLDEQTRREFVRLIYQKPEWKKLLDETQKAFLKEVDNKNGAATDYCYSGFPYLTSGHIRSTSESKKSNVDPEVTAAVAYALTCSANILDNSADLWKVVEEKSRWRKLRIHAREYLLQNCLDLGKKEGGNSRAWSAYPPNSPFRRDGVDEKPELFPTMLACQALLDDGGDAGPNGEAKKVLAGVITWLLRCLRENALRSGFQGWREYGQEGRQRLLDQVMALLTLFQCSTVEQLVQESYLVTAAVQEFLRRLLSLSDFEPDYHLFRGDDLVGLVPWEDYSLLYWCLGLLFELQKFVAKEEKRLKEEEEDVTSGMPQGHYLRERQTMLSTLKELLRSSLTRTATKELLKRLETEKNRDGMWPRNGMRVYVSWNVATLKLSQSKALRGLGEEGIEDVVFVGLYRTFTEAGFASNFAQSVVRSLVINHNLQEERLPQESTSEPTDDLEATIAKLD